MKNRQKGIKLIINTLSLLVALPSGFLVAMKGVKGGMDLLMIYLVLLVSIAIAIILQTAIHEAGHMVFGLLTGYRFLSYRVLSFFVSLEDGKLKTGKFSLPGTLGQCLMATPSDKERKPYFLYNAGGVIVNLISALLCYLVAFTAKSTVLAMFMAINGMYALIMAISNGIPYNGAGVANDGCNIKELHDHPETIDTFYNMLDLNESMLKGARTADVPKERIDLRETTLHSGGIGASNLLWQENRLMDRHHFKKAEELIKEISEKDYPLIDLHKNMLMLDQKYIDCLYGNFEDITDKKILKYLEASRKSVLAVMRYLYVRALYLKDEKEAEKNLQAFLAMEKGYPFPGEYQSEKEYMEIALEKISKQTGKKRSTNKKKETEC